MRTPTTAFREYLSPEEEMVKTADGALLDGDAWTDGFVGLTDRRLLFVGDDGEFADVDCRHVCSIRSRTRRPFTPRGLRFRQLGAFGGVLALVAFAGAIVTASSGIGAFLVTLTVGSIVVGESIRRTGVDIDWEAISKHVPGTDRGATIGTVRADGTRIGRGEDGGFVRQRWRTKYVYVHQLLLFGSVIVAVTAGIGLVVHTGGVLVVLLVAATVGGLVVAEDALRGMRRLNEAGASRRDEREIRIGLVSGGEVSVRFDARSRIDRTLAGATGENASAGAKGPIEPRSVRP